MYFKIEWIKKTLSTKVENLGLKLDFAIHLEIWI